MGDGYYGRHAKAWQAGGNAALRKELNRDLKRLWLRNLGRDNRIVSDAARELLFPFLDFHVVQFLRCRVPLDFIVDYRLLPAGVGGDKRILRQVAQRMGLQSAAVAVKRAIDKRGFGSRRKAAGVATVLK